MKRWEEEALDRALWRTRFGRGSGPVEWNVPVCCDVSSFQPHPLCAIHSHSVTTLMCHCVVMSVCLSVCAPYDHLLPVSQFTMMSVCPLTANFFLSVSQSTMMSVCVSLTATSSTPTCSWHCRTCSRPMRNIVFFFNWISSRRTTKCCSCQLVTYFSRTDISRHTQHTLCFSKGRVHSGIS